MKILIIDDEKDLVELLQMQLESDSISVDIAHNGQEALELINKNNYDLIISDNHMPELTGVDLLKKVNHKRFYIMSGNTDLKDEVLSLGGKGLINKPFDIAIIESLVEDLLEKS